MKVRSLLVLALASVLILAHEAAAQPTDPWRVFRKADGLQETACLSVTLGSGGNVLIRHPKSSAVSIFDGYEFRTVPAPITTSRIYESSGGQLWALTAEGLAEFREGEWLSHAVPEIAGLARSKPARETPLLPIRQGRVLILLPDRLLRLDVEDAAQSEVAILRLAANTGLGAFTGMSTARDGGLWISGARGLAKLGGPLRSLKPDSSWTEFLPPESTPLRNFRPPQENAGGGLTALAESTRRELVLASFDGHGWSVRPLKVDGVQFAWSCGDTLCGATRDTFFELKDGQPVIVAEDEIRVRRIFDVAIEPEGAFWLATSDGLFRKAGGVWQRPGDGEVPADLQPGNTRTNIKTLDLNTIPGIGFSGQSGRLSPFIPGEQSDARIATTEWRTSFLAKNGDVWLGAMHNVAWRHQNAWTIFASTNQIGPENVLSFAESPEGRIWCATPGKVWQFDGKSWLVLRAGFEHINALRCTSEGTVWVATDNGLHRYTRGAWIVNGPPDGLESKVVRAVVEDERGGIWADTSRGPCRFTPQADSDPPKTFIRPSANSPREFREGAPVTYTFAGRDKWNITPPGRLLFSYRLDDREWTPFRELRECSFVDLPLGQHYFQVRAIDRNGNIDPSPIPIQFTVVVPWYRETRLVLILSVALGVAIFFAALAINRHRRLLLSYAEVERKITERTQELELANRELLHSQKMNALGTLAAGIAHDFNNILSIVKGSAQIIEDNPNNAEKIRTRLDRIKTVVQQGAGIVEAMLGFSRSSDQENGPCDLNLVVDDTVKLLGDRFLREVEVRLDRGQDLPPVVVARDFIQQILLNFVFNAAEAMSGRKHIVVSTRALTTPSSAVILAPARAQAYAAITVKDFGSGIAPENLPRIFEPFFTTKSLSARRGTGLGLSMAYELAKKMGAGLAVETAVGAGSTFTLILPAKKP